jgi:predicted ArsR family transcriptional regulator
VVLLNCPFHALAQDYRDLVCGMNLALLTGVIEELDGAGLEARLDPHPGE